LLLARYALQKVLRDIRY